MREQVWNLVLQDVNFLLGPLFSVQCLFLTSAVPKLPGFRAHLVQFLRKINPPSAWVQG